MPSLEAVESWLNGLSAEERAKVEAEIGTIIDKVKNMWSDDDYENKGHYYRNEDENNGKKPGEPGDPTTPTFEHPRLEIIEGTAGGGTPGSKSGIIDNQHFKVASNNPIPTSENLKGTVNTNIIGKVNDLRII